MRISNLSLAHALIGVVLGLHGSEPSAIASELPSQHAVEQWNQIAENTVIASGAFQNEGLIYMAYVSAAVYDAVAAIDGRYRPLHLGISAAAGASADAAVVEAAYRTLRFYFPAQAPALDTLYTQALAQLPRGRAKDDGTAVGRTAAATIIAQRQGDGRQTPIGVTSPFELLPPGPGVWRLTPPFAAPQTPWVGAVRPFVLRSAEQFSPAPPPRLTSARWNRQFEEVKLFGASTSTVRSPEQTTIARFWTANVIRQYNRAGRDVAASLGLSPVQTGRLLAMINVIGADAQIAVMHSKYSFLFWRPVTAIEPYAVTSDGFGPVPGFEDGNRNTIEEPGWRPLIVTPNHPEYPAAHGSITAAMAAVFSEVLETDAIDLDLHGFDAAGATGNLDAVRHFATADDLRAEIVNARVWAGVHYRGSAEAGVALGRKVAGYDLRHAFRELTHDD